MTCFLASSYIPTPPPPPPPHPPPPQGKGGQRDATEQWQVSVIFIINFVVGDRVTIAIVSIATAAAAEANHVVSNFRIIGPNCV